MIASPIPGRAQLTTEHFLYDGRTKTLTADYSDLRELHTWAKLPGIIVLQSARTGNKRGFSFVRQVPDADGAPAKWVFRNATDGLNLVIYND